MAVEDILVVPEEPVPGIVAGLLAILVLVLVLPFKVKKVEENLEPFFFVMGLIAVALNFYYGLIPGGEQLRALAVKAFETPFAIAWLGPIPIGIVQAVFFFGLVFLYFHRQIYSLLGASIRVLGWPLFVFSIITIMGLVSSIISVIVTAVILAEIIAALNMPRDAKIKFTVYAAFAVGLGAALTPIGEPLSTIAVSKLNAPFDYLFRLLGLYIIPGVLLVAAWSVYQLKGYADSVKGMKLVYEETINVVIERAFRVFLFVAALELLGMSFTPLVKWYFSQLPSWALYWINTISAVVDNATLTAAEIGPYLTEEQIRSALMSLLISGGMLIPGNIPNIVAAGRLKITSREWARIGVPFGAALLLLYFIVIEVLGIHITL